MLTVDPFREKGDEIPFSITDDQEVSWVAAEATRKPISIGIIGKVAKIRRGDHINKDRVTTTVLPGVVVFRHGDVSTQVCRVSAHGPVDAHWEVILTVSSNVSHFKASCAPN